MFHQLLYMVTGTCDYLWYQGESNLKTFYLTGFQVKIFQHWVTIMVIISGKLRCSFCIFSSCYTKLLFHRSSLVFVCKWKVDQKDNMQDIFKKWINNEVEGRKREGERWGYYIKKLKPNNDAFNVWFHKEFWGIKI